MINSFEFMLPTRILFGAGRLVDTGAAVSSLGRKAMIVCGASAVRNSIVQRLQNNFAGSGVAGVLYDQVISNPTTEIVDRGADLAKSGGCDVIVGLGGGSAIDVAKGIAVAATHKGTIWPYAIGEIPITDSTLPIVAVTTTSGSGSHCTCFAVITNPETHEKPGMGAPFLQPRVAVIDPELMRTMPPRLTAVSGLDVFCHAVEALTSKAASSMSDLFAQKAVELVGRHLPTCYRDGCNLKARTGMALADTYAGIAICHAVVTFAHAMAHVISGHYPDIAHGEALYAVYREVLKLNASAAPEKHCSVARQIDQGNNNVISAFENFFAQFHIENKLKARKPDRAMIETMAAETFGYMKGVTDLNEVEVGVDDARRILMASLS